MPFANRILWAGILTAAIALSQSNLAKFEGSTVGDDGQPLPDIRVTLRGGAPGPNQKLQTVTSDSEGKFVFDGVEPGQYTLTADHAGYVTAFYSPTVRQHSPALSITLTRQTVLSGRVVDEDGNSMPHVTVRPMRPELMNGVAAIGSAGAGTQTGDDGRFRMSVAPGRWYLSYAAPSKPPAAKPQSKTQDAVERWYGKAYYPGGSAATDALPIDAVAGQERSGLDVKLRKTAVFHVRGTVAGDIPSGTAAKVLLKILVSEPGDPSGALFDDGLEVSPDGSFDISLPAGAWTLTVVKRDRNRESLGQRTIQIVDGDVDRVALNVRPPVNLSGSVKTVPEPAPNSVPPVTDAAPLVVKLTPLGSVLGFNSARVQSDGTFALTRVGAGRYFVDVTSVPASGYIKSIFFGGHEVIDTGIDLTENVAALDLQIVIGMTAGQVVGSVRSDTGQAPDAIVTLFPVTSQPAGPAVYRPELHPAVRSDENGQFTLTGVVPGKYRVYAWERFDAYLLADTELMKLFDSLGSTVTVAEKELQNVTLHLISTARMNDEIRRHGR